MGEAFRRKSPRRGASSAELDHEALWEVVWHADEGISAGRGMPRRIFFPAASAAAAAEAAAAAAFDACLGSFAAFHTNSRRLIRILMSWGLVGAKKRKQGAARWSSGWGKYVKI